MYSGSEQIGSDGKSYKLDESTRISPKQGMWIYELFRRAKPKWTLEIGLAYGFSTCFILAAHKANGGGQHIACDPFQSFRWRGIGLQKPRQLGMEKSFRWIEEVSSLAIPTLRKDGFKFDAIFIDGDHRFDSLLVDFVLSDLVCTEGGFVVLDDMWMPSIQKAVAFIDRNRSDYVKEKTPIPNITVYRKVGKDKRDWRHFVDF